MEKFGYIKVGDKVTILSSSGKPNKITSVTKVLKYYFVADDTKFGFDGGQKTRELYYRINCVPWKQEHSDYIRVENKRYRLNKNFTLHLSEFKENELDEMAEVLAKFGYIKMSKGKE